MADLKASPRRRDRRDGACPTGAHSSCDILTVRPLSLVGALYMEENFHFEATEETMLDIICIDDEIAADIIKAVESGLRIDGLEALSALARRTTGSDGALLCACGNTPSPADGRCRQCRRAQRAPRQPRAGRGPSQKNRRSSQRQGRRWSRDTRR